LRWRAVTVSINVNYTRNVAQNKLAVTSQIRNTDVNVHSKHAHDNNKNIPVRNEIYANDFVLCELNDNSIAMSNNGLSLLA